MPPRPDETREASVCPGGSSHPPTPPFTAVCLPLRTHFLAGLVAGRTLRGVEGSAQGSRASPLTSPGTLLYSDSAFPVPAATRAVPGPGPDCGAQILREPCAVHVGAPGTVAALPRRPLWKTPRTGFEPLVYLTDHPGVRRPPALSESQHPASLTEDSGAGSVPPLLAGLVSS